LSPSPKACSHARAFFAAAGEQREGARNIAVLLTGGAECIGSDTVSALLERGSKSGVLDNLTTGFDWA
jgi:hypothetical protein